MTKIISSICLLTALCSCATIVSGSNQSLSVNTGNVSGATCDLINSKGTWYVTTPGTVTIHKAYGDMNINCKKDGYQAAQETSKSSVTGWMFGNILFGGIIGAGVDMGTGDAFEYPNPIGIKMNLLAPAPVNPSSVIQKRQ